MLTGSFDYVIVGAGTAGCVLAARLSEDPLRRVLLLEAGRDYAATSVPPSVLDARYVPMRGHAPQFDPQHDWGLTFQSGGGSSIAVPQARLVGGGAAINGTIALRGATADYREWVELGNPAWSWESVLPAFRALENDDAPGENIHGRKGPVRLTRATAEELAPLQRAFMHSALRSTPYLYTGDLNATDAEGVGPAPQTRYGPIRLSTAATYLDPARGRSNLTVVASSLVTRVIFDGDRAIGVETTDGELIRAKEEVVLTSGAIMTPAILQRSGVGPSELLASLGISLVEDLPVGENLGDHFAVPIMAPPVEGAWSSNDYSLQAVLRASTSVQPGSLDCQLTMFSYLNLRTTGDGVRGLGGEGANGVENVAGIGCVLNKPRSVGTVRVSSIHAAQLPIVSPNYLDKQIDRDAIREIVRLGWAVITAEPLAGMLGTPLGLDQGTVDSDDRLDAVIKVKTASGYHLSGSCRMAPVPRGGVVDQSGAVHRVRGLRIADASVIPTTPAANTMLTTIMVAERIAASVTGSFRIGI